MLNWVNVRAEEVLTEKEYVIDELGYYLSGWNYEKDDEIQLSQKFEVNEAQNDSSVYFVKVNDTTIGAITVSMYEGEMISSFMYSENGIDVETNKDIAVVSDNNGLNFYNTNEIKSTTGVTYDYKAQEKISKYKKKKIKFNNINKKINIDSRAMTVEMNNSDAINETDNFYALPENVWNTNFINVGTHEKTYEKVMSNSSNKLLLYMNKVPFRKNQYAIVNNAAVGICWAAAGASIINYRKGTSLTTKNVYNQLKNYYNQIPNGSVEWNKRMFGYYGLSMTYVENKLPFSTVLLMMESKRPIFCVFYHYDGNRNNDYSHAVVLCGCYYRTDLGKYYYVYMDPNYADNKVYIVNHIPTSVLSTNSGYTFYYNDGGGDVYNNWTRACY